MAVPTREENIQFLHENQVNHLVSLTIEPPDVFKSSPNLVVFRCPIEDFTAPTQNQIEECLKFIESTNKNGQAVGVHCEYGIGRAGTILACYLVKFCNMTDREAIVHIRTLRHPNSVESEEQERAISLFYESYLVVFRCPIKEYAAPTQRQIENCLKFIENSLKGGEAVGVHCKQGIGRTGTILACYFVKFCGMTASEAIAYIRTVRPRNSVDGEERERAVSLFYESCQKS